MKNVRKPKSRVKKHSKNRKSDEEIDSESEASSVVSGTESDTSVHENAHEKKVRLTKKAIQKALETVGSDDEKYEALSLRLKEEALQAKGKFLAKFAHQIKCLEKEKIILLKGHRKSVSCVCISDDGKFAYTGGKDSSVNKWDLNTMVKLYSMPGGKRGTKYPYHTGPILSIAISSDSRYLASSSMDHLVIIWNPDEMKVCMKLSHHKVPVTAVSFRHHSHMLFTADCSGRVCVWNMPLKEVLQDQGARTNIEVLGLCGLISERCVSCSGFGGPGVCVWKVPEEICVQYSTKNVLESSVECIYAVNDEIFIGGASTNTIYVWHSSRGSPVFTVSPAHPVAKLCPPSESEPFIRPVANWVSAVTGLYGTDLIASGSSTGHIQFWRLVQPQPERSIEVKGEQQQQSRTQVSIERIPGLNISLGGFINGLAFSSDRRYLAVCLGQEHRFGHWEPRRHIKNGLLLIPLNVF
uniref:U3 small nucleolar RNA-interacting protein 2 n=1 Tax=Schistosoma japonicum TaxID=6182 RepID=C1LGK5_SCHJA|nr:U3 small nucleolar RNA-interacting protein 2 [Schistosoma japonicum]